MLPEGDMYHTQLWVAAVGSEVFKATAGGVVNLTVLRTLAYQTPNWRFRFFAYSDEDLKVYDSAAAFGVQFLDCVDTRAVAGYKPLLIECEVAYVPKAVQLGIQHPVRMADTVDLFVLALVEMCQISRFDRELFVNFTTL